MFKMSMIMIMTLVMFLIISHPSLKVLCLSLISVQFLVVMKQNFMSLNIYIVLIIFVTGVMMLLFYLTISYTNFLSSKNNFLIFLMIFPISLYLMNFNSYKFISSSSLSNNINSLMSFDVMILSMIFIIILLLTMSAIFKKIKFLRQFK